mmetsp:Transcript_14463/g.20391  ORF Transcript_14463/g.20391 Transcript_14463/m.20391 type:complete len:156 (+) Transcript_14463:199-666(+)
MKSLSLVVVHVVYLTTIVVTATTSSNPTLRGNSIEENVDTITSSIDKLKKCLVKHTENACQDATDNCAWCEVKGKNGLCMPSMYAIAAQCDKWGDLDATCILKVTEDGDPQTLCQNGQDQEGTPCIWCHGWLGEVCLDKTQAETAGTLLGCHEIQ